MLFASSILFAKTEVLFSPRGAIKDAIIKNINSSEKSIDIAVLIFTAGEIAEALYEAKERGVKIRIIIDRKQEKKRYPVLEFLKEKDFELRFLKGNTGGFMNHTFAIFDVERLVTGSYNWTEYAEKFNYENALFIDEPDTIKSFQEEFESLYGKSSMDRISKLEESGSYISSSKVEAITERNNEQVESAIESSNGFLNISFMEFNNIFGKDSTLGKAEKKQLWKNKFKGKDVRWTGKVIYKGIAVYDWNRVVVEHEGVDTNVQLRFNWTKRRTVMRVNVGDVITYTGRLVSLQGFSASYKLAYADVLRGKIK
jgi:phosphatidylserine/phosphatidylglycerophosphate/cardiolipin synthase-like enzyme